MADECQDIGNIEEISVCGRWLEGGKPVERFLTVIPAHGAVNAALISSILINYMDKSGLENSRLRALGFDGAAVMSGNRTGDLRCFSDCCRNAAFSKRNRGIYSNF